MIRLDTDDSNADWSRENAWRDWPEDLDDLREWVLAHGWSSVAAFRQTPIFAQALLHRPELEDL